jgi:hypothetical protein
VHMTRTWDIGRALKWVSSGQVDPTIGTIQIAILNCTVCYAKFIKKKKKKMNETLSNGTSSS